MRKVLLIVALVVALLALAPAGAAHKVTPPGKDGECTTNVHAGDPSNPAHTGEHGMNTANAHSDAISSGACP